MTLIGTQLAIVLGTLRLKIHIALDDAFVDEPRETPPRRASGEGHGSRRILRVDARR